MQMAWKWFTVNSYKVSVGSDKPASGYGNVQLMGTNFYGLLKFVKSGALPAATAPIVAGGQRFYGSLDFAQMSAVVDLLRHERPINFGWFEGDPNIFHLMTGTEPVGEGKDETPG
jgi:hypothetical protein